MKKILLTSLTAAALAISAQAASLEITITGATAMRADLFAGIDALYGAGLTARNSDQASEANYKSAQKCTWSGTMAILPGYNPVIVRCSMSGSVGGVQDLAALNAVTCLLNASPDTDVTTTTKLPDFALSDVFQDSTGVAGDLEDTFCGVIPLAYVRGLNTSASITNITTQLCQSFLAVGSLSGYYFTGNPADTFSVKLIGRNNESGSRATAHADSFFGVFATSKVYTNSPLPTSVPFALVGNNAGTHGYSSGGDIAKVLAANDTSANKNVVGYVGLKDARTADATGTRWLTYSGVPYSQAAVRNGTYTFWGYEHIFNLVGLDADKVTFRDELALAIDGAIVDAIATHTAIKISTMLVTRAGDGGNIQ